MDMECDDYSMIVSDDFGFGHLEQFARMIFGLLSHGGLLLVAELLRSRRRKCLIVNSPIKCKNSFLCSIHRQVYRRSIKVRIENQEKLIGLSRRWSGQRH